MVLSVSYRMAYSGNVTRNQERGYHHTVVKEGVAQLTMVLVIAKSMDFIQMAKIVLLPRQRIHARHDQCEASPLSYYYFAAYIASHSYARCRNIMIISMLPHHAMAYVYLSIILAGLQHGMSYIGYGANDMINHQPF